MPIRDLADALSVIDRGEILEMELPADDPEEVEIVPRRRRGRVAALFRQQQGRILLLKEAKARVERREAQSQPSKPALEPIAVVDDPSPLPGNCVSDPEPGTLPMVGPQPKKQARRQLKRRTTRSVRKPVKLVEKARKPSPREVQLAKRTLTKLRMVESLMGNIRLDLESAAAGSTRLTEDQVWFLADWVDQFYKTSRE